LPNTSNIILDEIFNPFSTHELRIDKNNLNRSNVIYFANPNNPTGRSFPKDEIERYISSNPEKLFVIDEAYFEYSRNTMAEEVNTYKNLIITRTFSKAFSLAGLRVGYVIADIDVINILKKIKNIKSVNDIAIKAAKLVLENKELFQQHIQEVNASRDLLIQNTKNFKKLKIFDSESNFVLLKAENSEKLKKIFYKNKILIRDKSNEVLLSDCLRITLGGSEVHKKIMNVLIDYEKS
jgi:histidinol-phosphate aminotransferase